MISHCVPGRDERRKSLEHCLAAFHLKIRNDSVLCVDFVNGHSPLTAETIAQRMAHVEYLHKYRRTEYQAAVDREALVYGYKKAVCIVQAKPEFAPPIVYPWMKE